MPARERGARLDGVRGAATFLTVLPLQGRGRSAPDQVGRGALFFPLVGAAVGGVSALTAWLASLVLPPTIAALAAIGVGVLLTGALHLDGLADTADGYGGRTRERALAIMRDHTIGPFGVIALIMDLGLRTAVIIALLPRPRLLLALVAAGAVSRATSVGLGILVPAAHADGAHASLLVGASRWRAAVAVAIGVAIATATLGWSAIAAALLVAAIAAGWAWHCRRRLGGLTGDTLGAASEISELAVLVFAVAVR